MEQDAHQTLRRKMNWNKRQKLRLMSFSYLSVQLKNWAFVHYDCDVTQYLCDLSYFSLNQNWLRRQAGLRSSILSLNMVNKLPSKFSEKIKRIISFSVFKLLADERRGISGGGSQFKFRPSLSHCVWLMISPAWLTWYILALTFNKLSN